MFVIVFVIDNQRYVCVLDVPSDRRHIHFFRIIDAINRFTTHHLQRSFTLANDRFELYRDEQYSDIGYYTMIQENDVIHMYNDTDQDSNPTSS